MLKPRFVGEKPVVSVPIEQLRLAYDTTQVTTGGGFVGGGVGLLGAAKGMIQADILNKLTTARLEYALLWIYQQLPNGTQRRAVLGFPHITESNLRDRFAAAIPAWAEDYVVARLCEMAETPAADTERAALYAQVDRMRGRGMLTADQTLALSSTATKLHLDKLLQHLRTHPPSQQQLQRYEAEFEDLC